MRNPKTKKASYLKEKIEGIDLVIENNAVSQISFLWKPGLAPESLPAELEEYCSKILQKKFSGERYSPIVRDMVKHEILFILADAEIMGRIYYDLDSNSYVWVN